MASPYREGGFIDVYDMLLYSISHKRLPLYISSRYSYVAGGHDTSQSKHTILRYDRVLSDTEQTIRSALLCEAMYRAVHIVGVYIIATRLHMHVANPHNRYRAGGSCDPTCDHARINEEVSMPTIIDAIRHCS